MMTTVTYPHIEFSPEGAPYITGTQTKVIEVVLDRLAYHWDADEIHRQHSHLSLSQIYSALAYYYDHQAEMDREIEDQLRQAEQIKASLGESPVRLKLKAMGRLAKALDPQDMRNRIEFIPL
jgi:uncharacterized protein (DUF433 family)